MGREEVDSRSLRERRKRLGFTQAEVAAESGVGESTLSRIEQGSQRPYAYTLRAVVKALDVLQARASWLGIPRPRAAKIRATAGAWYRDRLADPTLLDRALAVDVDPAGDLAVPVGGQRRAGTVVVPGVKEAARLVLVLEEHPGFPSPRVSLVPGVGGRGVMVRWGEDEPPVPGQDASVYARARWAAECGELYGYSGTAVGHHLGELLKPEAVVWGEKRSQ
jgi:transcriptional regulator with XRE-family HTH domain